MVRAVANRVLCEVIPHETVTDGGIHLPDTYERHRLTRGECMKARVVAVGPEVYDCKPGMVLLIDPNQVEDCTFTEEGTTYVSVPEVYFNWKTEKGPLFGVHMED